jgi:hypothetical protein
MLKGDFMIKVKKIDHTCIACPSQWEGTTVDGKELYVRYRWGILRIDLDGETIFKQQLGDELDGIIEWEDIEDILEEL